MTMKRTINSAVVTGPTGPIGMALCETLLGKNIEVFAVLRPNSRHAQRLDRFPNAHIIECDASELLRLPDIIDRKADAFFHFAWDKAASAGRNDMNAQIRNIQFTLEACRAAKSLGCSVFIGSGSQAEYGRVEGILTPETPCNPENGYGMAKLCAGQMSRVECEKLGIDHIWARVLSIYGPYDGDQTMIMSTIQKLLNGEKPALTPGEQKWDYLYSKDVGEAFCLLANSGRSGAIYPIGSGIARPLKEYIEIMRDEIDPSLPLGLGDVPYGAKQVMHLEADISALRADTGFKPETDFRAGIRNTIEYVRRQNNG